jgi:hypothetical protein
VEGEGRRKAEGRKEEGKGEEREEGRRSENVLEAAESLSEVLAR